MVRIFFFYLKRNIHTNLFFFLNVYLYTRIMRLFVDFSLFFWVCVHVSFRDKWSRNRYRSFKACFPVCVYGSLKRAALPRVVVVSCHGAAAKKSLSSISGTCEQIVFEVDGTLATQKKMENKKKGPFSVDVRSIRRPPFPVPPLRRHRVKQVESGEEQLIRETHYKK